MRNFLNKIFNRIAITILIVLLQIGFVVTEILKFSTKQMYIELGMKMLSVVVVFIIIYKQSNPASKLAWIVPILLFPILGGFLYLMFGHLFIPHRMKKNIDSTNILVRENMNQDISVIDEVNALDANIYSQFYYVSKYAPAPVFKNTDTRYFADGSTYVDSLLEDLSNAKRYIFMEYFIISSGVIWDKVLAILEKKVSEGVEVRLIYDDFGSAMGLPKNYFEQLRKKGIKCISFNRIVPFMALILNNRDHRKNVVIDGQIGYTGGINLADEYANIITRFGVWKDAGVRIEGDAVWNMTVLFLQMWNISSKTDDNFGVYKAHIDANIYNDGFVQPYGDSPLDSELVGESVYLNIINNAKKYLWIYTPYLIIDNVMNSALVLACKRGVDVRIVTPGIPDKKMIFYMTRCSYKPLVDAGARIYEYTPGFIHAKCTLCDDEIVNIGSVNYDYRSLYHHFECGILMYNSKVYGQLKEDMLATFEESEEISEEFFREKRFNINVAGPVLHLFAPLL